MCYRKTNGPLETLPRVSGSLYRVRGVRASGGPFRLPYEVIVAVANETVDILVHHYIGRNVTTTGSVMVNDHTESSAISIRFDELFHSLMISALDAP